jgi:hypothetical protein
MQIAIVSKVSYYQLLVEEIGPRRRRRSEIRKKKEDPISYCFLTIKGRND